MILSWFKNLINFGWKNDLVLTTAKLTINYNSYYKNRYSFVDFLTGEKQDVTLCSQFIPQRIRFEENEFEVKCWKIKKSLLTQVFSDLEIQFYGNYQLRQGSESVCIYIPEPLAGFFLPIVQRLKDLCDTESNSCSVSTDNGYLTSSGRSIWLINKNQYTEPLCIKLHTFDMVGISNNFNTRTLTKQNLAHSIKVNDYLSSLQQNNFMKETCGVSILIEGVHPFVALERYIDFRASQIQYGDFIIPMQAIVSPDFWSNKKNIDIFGLAYQRPNDFFSGDFVKCFSDLIRNSIENTFLHFEVHQQNLSCHFKGGKLVKIIYHDLLDTIFDPVSFFLCNSDSLEPIAWGNSLKFIGDFYQDSFFNFAGEVRSKIKKHNHFFTVASLYRRYLRNLGNFTRLYNFYSDENYLLSKKFEKLMLDQLNYSIEHIQINDESNFLKNDLFWTIHHRVMQKQNDRINILYTQYLNPENRKNDSQSIFQFKQRIKNEDCFLSCNMPLRIEDVEDLQISEICQIMSKQVYICLSNNIKFLVLFVATKD